jgi:hypothetical protein
MKVSLKTNLHFWLSCSQTNIEVIDSLISKYSRLVWCDSYIFVSLTSIDSISVSCFWNCTLCFLRIEVSILLVPWQNFCMLQCCIISMLHYWFCSSMTRNINSFYMCWLVYTLLIQIWIFLQLRREYQINNLPSLGFSIKSFLGGLER